ncbi:LysR family transcriptional regulator [Mesorhizobium sp.]|uniref:LysR family transcriptional regulator n=1 Tax=Mesorhizobium sp. TaxID=1871066 RepID=UPI000FE8A664|nr:LysR substrate-binding domain-containing protein [Mesorhizobium sp.]RWK94393.1 MAG: LysR family transcriptional regulator [Mesorhizobium sp.]TIQ27154.1 MAG: LysR family transcriptional regulator [Mesorhizobium sp.]
MSWDLRHARIFIAVAEELHFSRAAQKLHLAQSAVSRTVRWMEQDLKVTLLNRSTRNVALTSEGALLLDECRQIVAQFERSIKRTRSIATGFAGEIDVGCNDFSFLAELPVIVPLFRRRFPDITMRLHEGERSQQLDDLSTGKLDIAFIMGPADQLNNSIKTVTTAKYPLTVLIKKNHPLTKRKTLKIRDLADESFIFGSRPGWNTYRRFIETLFDDIQFVPRITQEVYGSIGIFGLVASGLGVSIYPDCRVPIQYQNLAVRPLVDVERQVETTAVWYPKTLTRAASHFVSFVQEYCASVPAA